MISRRKHALLQRCGEVNVNIATMPFIVDCMVSVLFSYIYLMGVANQLGYFRLVHLSSCIDVHIDIW